MKIYVALLATFIAATGASAQLDTSQLLKQATLLLENQAGVSTLLTDKAYAPLHPLTSFRNLVQKHASSNVLSIAAADEPGKRIKVIATIKIKDGQPVSNALVYLYQTDYRGWYAAEAPHVGMNEGDYRHARLFGYARTDKNGKMELHTIKPAGYPQSDLPAHIHVHISVAGYRPYATEFLFQDDERLKGEILNRAIVDGGMIAVPEAAESPFVQKFTYEIRLIKL